MAGLQPDIYAAISITWIIAFLALLMRIKARGMMKTKLWFDDYFAIVALVCIFHLPSQPAHVLMIYL